ncbi:MAG TPA: YbhB/YbcL family Raf kinase inhibitor-like protein [Planctomycetota bacterium]|nr:YbhB/YbcL family Raf kinase inhibitor-like protein [Planctomycetota bacterium]
MAFSITTQAFDGGARIPKDYTGDGADDSPDLAWGEGPSGTKSYALVCDDPDAPGKVWVHWVLFDLPASTRSLERGVPKQNALPSGAKQGRNDFGKIGYGGPAPPRGHGTHHYHFKLYALDASLGLGAGATKVDVEKAMKGHVLAQAEIVGTYSR